MTDESANPPEPVSAVEDIERTRLSERETRMAQIRAAIDREMDALVGRTDYENMTFSELAAASEDGLSYGGARAAAARRIYIEEAIARKKAELAPRVRPLWIFLIVGGFALVGAAALAIVPTPMDPSVASALATGKFLVLIVAGAVGITLMIFFVQSAPSSIRTPNPRTRGEWPRRSNAQQSG